MSLLNTTPNGQGRTFDDDIIRMDNGRLRDLLDRDRERFIVYDSSHSERFDIFEVKV